MAPGFRGLVWRDDGRVLRALRGVPLRIRALGELSRPSLGKQRCATGVVSATMDIAAWIAQAIAALAFGVHGYTLLFRPEQALRQYPWAGDVPEGTKRLIGTAEVL